MAIQRFKNSNCYIQHISLNDDFSHLLCTCSDRALRLYFFDFKALQLREKSSKGSKQQSQNLIPQKVIYLKNEIKDVINGRKWQNSAFIKLNKNLMIVD